MTTPLYDTDFDAWVQQQAQALRAKDWAALDIDHLAEEVEGLRKTERKTAPSQIRLVMSHLLKWAYQPERCGESGQATIRNARSLVADWLEDSPSLMPDLPALPAWAYPRTRREAAKYTGHPPVALPEACPWAPEQVLDADFCRRPETRGPAAPLPPATPHSRLAGSAGAENARGSVEGLSDGTRGL